MDRRSFLTASAAVLAMPALAQGSARVLRVVPQANLTSLDPVWTTATITQNHGYMIYDQLVAIDSSYAPRPQMAAGWTQEDDGRTWTFTLRDGLKFHDGEKVLAKDVVASIRRWGARDGFGQELMAVTDELAALDDMRLRFRLKRPFPLILAALGRIAGSPCFVMPERVAQTDPFTQIRETVGSGPFRFLADEWVPGARVAYAKNEAYAPRDEPLDWIAGGRRVLVDRVEWSIITDPGTAAAALQNGETDYWENPVHDLLPTLRRNANVVVEQRNPLGIYGTWRFNHLQKPFDNPAIRRAVAMGADQADFQRAVVGDEPSLWGRCEGWFTCDTPLASDRGGEALKVRNVERAKAALREAGYAGERVVMLIPADFPSINAQALVGADLLKRLGMNVDAQTMDWGTLVQRRASKEPVDKGGWSMFLTTWGGDSMLNPAVHATIRGNADRAWFGWPNAPEIEAARGDWFAAPDPAAQKAAADRITEAAFANMPYIPTGYFFQPAAWRKTVQGVLKTPITTVWGFSKTA